jgi:hypothetical protein
MKFKINGVVWDRETESVLAQGDARGIFETADETVIKKLDKLNYPRLDETVSTKEPEPASITENITKQLEKVKGRPKKNKA